MKYLELTFPTPAENLACDEALLDEAESGAGGEILRFWEPGGLFVVVGYANRVAIEANVAACEQHQIGIFRRCTGGGTVLQGPGCLNYTLILRIPDAGPLQSISGTNRFIMERQATALESLIGRPVQVQGHTDLSIGNLKFSGNAQRRRRRFLIFHGAFLLHFDLALIEQFLQMPSQQPDYRQHRPHCDFLTNLNLPSALVQQVLRAAWNAMEPLTSVPTAAINDLARTKYATSGWNRKF